MNLNGEAGLETLVRMFPLRMFHFSRFSILTITYVTTEYALEKIKDILVNHHGKADEPSYEPIVQSLKSIAGSNDLEFGLLPLFRVNNKLVEDIDAYCHSIIFSLGKQQGVMKNYFFPLVEKFIANPKLLFFKDLDTAGPSQQQLGELLKLS